MRRVSWDAASPFQKAARIINGFFSQFYSSSNKEATVLTAYYITHPEHINQECGLCFVLRQGIRESNKSAEAAAVAS